AIAANAFHRLVDQRGRDLAAPVFGEATVNAIWEGSGNVMELDVLRVLNRGKDLFETVFAGLARDLGPAGKKTIDVLRAAI
ncbi:hypothetical protein AB9F39_37980, partial [Rhizobium leguminosarum]